MRKQLIAACAALAFISTSAFAAGVNIAKSKITWKGAKVVGSTHEGTVGIKKADLKFKDGEPVSGEIVIDMTTINNTDLSGSMKKKLEAHLKSDDFFSVKKHKTAKLIIKNIKKASDKFYLLTGELIIKGKKQPIKTKVEVVKTMGSQQVVKTNLKFDRTKFDVKYGSGSFFEDLGDKMISDDVEISVELMVEKDKKKVAAN